MDLTLTTPGFFSTTSSSPALKSAQSKSSPASPLLSAGFFVSRLTVVDSVHFNRRVQMRLRQPKPGDVVTVRSCSIYFYLPPGLPEFASAKIVGHESGRYIVEYAGEQWNIPMQCVDAGADVFLNGAWLDRNDRRVQKAMVRRARC